jgi:hypothetical protein
LGAPVDDRGCWVVAYAAFFDFDKAIIKREFLPHIEQAARVLVNNPDIAVNLAGHTDSIGSDEYNYGLGLRRAIAVKEVLIRNGVNPYRLQETSLGESQPIADNSSNAGRARNRRVEIHVNQDPYGASTNLGSAAPSAYPVQPPAPASPAIPSSSSSNVRPLTDAGNAKANDVDALLQSLD